MNKQKDRIIILIGAGGGFGRALAKVLAASGATLVLADIPSAPLGELVDAAKTAGAANASGIAVDVTDEASVSALFAGVRQAHGRADALIYLPGLSIAAPVTGMPVESYDKIVDVNLKGLFLSAKYFVPLTQPDRNPLITFISSQAATRANPNAPVYCAAKAAVSMFGQGLALQVMKQNVRVTAIKPGPVNTQGFWGDRPVPREKFMQAGDVAHVIDFVLNLPPHIVMHEVSFESFEFFKK
jgi:NAD(P)-dependent dehydrogenase (short-subunit alcohol dehydrogenase family)